VKCLLFTSRYSVYFALQLTISLHIEKFLKNLGFDVGVYGLRFVRIGPAASPDSEVFKETINRNLKRSSILGSMDGDTMLKNLPLMADMPMSVFLSSDGW